MSKKDLLDELEQILQQQKDDCEEPYERQVLTREQERQRARKDYFWVYGEWPEDTKARLAGDNSHKWNRWKGKKAEE